MKRRKRHNSTSRRTKDTDCVFGWDQTVSCFKRRMFSLHFLLTSTDLTRSALCLLHFFRIIKTLRYPACLLNVWIYRCVLRKHTSCLFSALVENQLASFFLPRLLRSVRSGWMWELSVEQKTLLKRLLLVITLFIFRINCGITVALRQQVEKHQGGYL